MKPLLKRFSIGTLTLIALLLFLAWDVFKFIAFLLGLAAVPDDFATTKTVVGAFLQWLLTTPWWVPSGLLVIPLGVLVYLVWRSASDFTLSASYRQQAADASLFAESMRRLNVLTSTIERTRIAAELIERLLASSAENEVTDPGGRDRGDVEFNRGRRERMLRERWDDALGGLKQAIRTIKPPSQEQVQIEKLAAQFETGSGHQKRCVEYDSVQKEISFCMQQAQSELTNLERITGLESGIQSLPNIAPRKQR